ncbi:MAG TPA: hypothetical protein VFR81_17565 [Longimicrobium sp.]|nr:hypothetical protein [Longimicrobium sp.]
MDEDLCGGSTGTSPDRTVAHIWALIAGRGIDHLDVDQVIEALAAALDEAGVTFVRDLPLTGFDVPDERIDLLVAPGIAVLLDVGASAPSLDRLRRCASPVGVRALAVLTDRSPDLYPAGHGQRHLVHGKSLCVHRIGRERP